MSINATLIVYATSAVNQCHLGCHTKPPRLSINATSVVVATSAVNATLAFNATSAVYAFCSLCCKWDALWLSITIKAFSLLINVWSVFFQVKPF
jgi:hypothetical protein